VPKPLAVRQGRADLAPDAPAAGAAGKKEQFAPLRHFLSDGDPERRLQLAERLADLYDQYQVYRADWLTDWAAGATSCAVPAARRCRWPDQCWQAQLWREVHESLPPERRWSGRATIHQQFMAAVEDDRPPAAPAAPRGPVRHVDPAVPDLAGDGRAVAPHPGAAGGAESLPVLLGRHHRRARAADAPPTASHQRGGSDLAAVPVEELHAHSHPLLASWGRQGRDFVRMLDEFDGGGRAPASATCGSTCSTTRRGRRCWSRCRRRCATCCRWPSIRTCRRCPDDRSIEFHIAHSAQREVEVLHDQLLSWFAQDPTAAPARRRRHGARHRRLLGRHHAVFDQHKRSDPRFIPSRSATSRTAA
jgi:exodeoxyribonuclease V gamma subunit